MVLARSTELAEMLYGRLSMEMSRHHTTHGSTGIAAGGAASKSVYRRLNMTDMKEELVEYKENERD